MIRYDLSPEQAHGLVDAAYRGHPCDMDNAHKSIDIADRDGYELFVHARPGYVCLRKNGMFGVVTICGLYAVHARRYLADCGIEEVPHGE